MNDNGWATFLPNLRDSSSKKSYRTLLCSLPFPSFLAPIASDGNRDTARRDRFADAAKNYRTGITG